MSLSIRRTTLVLAALLVVGLMLRLVAASWWHARLPPEKPFGFGDSESYWVLGEAIAKGKPYSFPPDDQRIFRTPGYPTCLSLLWLFFSEPPVWAARMQSVLFSTVSIAAVYWSGRRLVGDSAALWGAGICSVYPGSAAMGAFVLSEAPFTLCLVLQQGCMHRALDLQSGRSWIWAAWGGLLAAAAVYVRPSWLLFPLLHMAASWLACIVVMAKEAGAFRLNVGVQTQRPRERTQAWHAAAMTTLAGLVLVLSLVPWWVRNYRVCGQFVPTTLQVGASLYDGLRPDADGGSDMRFVPAFRKELHAEDAAKGQAIDATFEVRLDEKLKQAAIAWASEHPTAAGQLAVRKFLRMWNVWPNEPSFRSRTLCMVVAVAYVPLLLCLFTGIAVLGPWRGNAVLFWAPCVYFTLLHMVFVSSLRYRDPPLMAAMPLAGQGALRLWQWWEQARPRTLSTSSAT